MTNVRVTSNDPIDLLRVAVSDTQIVARRVARETIFTSKFQQQEFATEVKDSMHRLLSEFLEQTNTQ